MTTPEPMGPSTGTTPKGARRWIRFKADAAPGSRLSPEGYPDLVAVDAARYFVGLLGERSNASMVFTQVLQPDSLGHRFSPAEALAIDEALAAAFWETYQGCLMPPAVLRLLLAGARGKGGDALLDAIEDFRLELLDAPAFADATDVHTLARVDILLRGAHGEMDDRATAIGEFLCDYLLIQKAIADDVAKAEEERAPDEPRAAVLERLDRARRTTFETAIGVVLEPTRIINRVPPSERAAVEAFARRRTSYGTPQSVLAAFGGSKEG